MFDVAIIGAGASGLCAAIAAKRKSGKARVTLIEALPRVGKKILATGNGRCNLTNLNASAECYNSPFVGAVLQKYTPQTIIHFFESIGLKCVPDSEGRVYPMSNTASSVLDCLRFEAERLGVEVISETKADTIVKKNDIFIINGTKKAKSVILASGGKASPSQGSDGSGYKLLKSLGHKITPVYPALVQLTVKENVKALKGVRVRSHTRLVSDGKTVDRSEGELLFTDYGISGITVMDLSRSVKNLKCSCVADILPLMSEDDIRSFILDRQKNNPKLSCENVLGGILPKKAGQYILKLCGVKNEYEIKALTGLEINKIIKTVKNLTFEITGTNGFNNAQITVGGAELFEFNPQTLESKLVKNLYCTGELLDIDSVCGGFNLHWAWASGLTAGENSVE